MSTGALFNIGTRAMFASYAALQTTGHNIANAHTAGYSRQQVDLATAGGQFSGAGFFGKGVEIAGVTRMHNAFLTREAALSRSLASGDAARLDQLRRLETVFGMGESGIGFVAGQVLNALVDVASAPDDLSARQVVLARAQDLASRFRTADQQLNALQQGVSEEIRGSVATANQLARQIAELNQQIASNRGAGAVPNDLLDQRDRLISDLNAQVQVTQVAADDGSVSLFIGGGQALVLGQRAGQLVAQPDAFDSSKTRLAIDDAGVVRPLLDGSLGGGRIAGLLRYQEDDLGAARNALGRLATAFASAVNEQQARGLDLLGQPGSPLFGLAPPRVLEPRLNGIPLNGGTAQVEVAIDDASALRASDYELRYDGTAWSLRRLSDNTVLPFSPGDTVDGMTITVPSGAPAAGDRFLLQPVRQGADLRLLMTDPRGLAAASPVTATAGAANQGTLAVGGLHASADDPNLLAPVTITFTSETEFTITGPVTGSPPLTWTPGEPIVINGWTLQLQGTPRPGDTIAVGPSSDVASGNGNALAMVDLREAMLVGGESVTDAYASLLGDIGVRVQGAQSAADMSAAIAAEAEAQRAAVSGVNLDEEAARLMQFQLSYQAAAKMLQVAQSVFDTLLQASAR